MPDAVQQIELVPCRELLSIAEKNKRSFTSRIGQRIYVCRNNVALSHIDNANHYMIYHEKPWSSEPQIKMGG
jgi:hypothetical protein